MRHRRLASKLGRTSSHRRAMYRNLVTSLLEHERIETTDGKAKELRRLAERMITLGKRGTLHARRRALRVVRSKDVTAKLFGDLAERYRERPGGYTRIVKSRRRVGDAAPLSLVELVEAQQAPVPRPSGGGRGRKRKTSPKPEEKAEKAAPRRRRARAEAAEAEKAGGRGGRRRAAAAKASEEAPAKTRKGGGARKTSGRKTSGRKGSS